MSSTSNEPRHAPRLAYFLYGAVALLFWASLYTYVPTLPTYARTFTDDLALVGLIIAMYGLAQAVVRVPLGIVADWAGSQKPFIVLGLLLAAGGALLMGSAHTSFALLVGRSVTGLAAATWVPLTVVFSALYPPEQAVRATTVLTLMSAIAKLVATATNGSLNTVGGYPLAFMVAAALAGLGVLLLLRAPEKRRPVQTPATGRIFRLFTRKDVLAPALLSALVHYVVQGVSFGFVPILARDLGASDPTISLLTVVQSAVTTLTVLTVTFLLTRFRAGTLVVAAFVMLATGAACAALATDMTWLFASQAFVGIGFGIAYSILMGMSIEHVDGAERTTAMGLHQSVYAIGMFVGPWLSGILAGSLGMRPMFGVTAGLTLVVGILGTAWCTRGSRTLATAAG